MSSNASNIVRTAEYSWRYWDRYHTIPSGCYRRDWEHPNFYVCASRLAGSRQEVKEAFEELSQEFNPVRVNSRQRDGTVFDHDSVSDRAAYWTLEFGEDPTEDRPEGTCLAIVVDNERRS